MMNIFKILQTYLLLNHLHHNDLLCMMCMMIDQFFCKMIYAVIILFATNAIELEFIETSASMLLHVE